MQADTYIFDIEYDCCYCGKEGVKEFYSLDGPIIVDEMGEINGMCAECFADEVVELMGQGYELIKKEEGETNGTA